MARYTDESRERVREAVDFTELVGARTELRRAGVARMEGLCPFHEERTPSFGINPVEKVYYCFGCGEGGDVFKFVMETEGLDFGSALESLAERYRVPLERESEDPRDAARRQRRERLLALLERTAAYYVRVLWDSDDAAAARAYLESRGLEEPALRAYRVGFAPNSWDKVVVGSRRAGYSEDELLSAGLAVRGRNGLIDRFHGRITFPLADVRGRVLGFGARAMAPEQKPKYLNTSENEIFHKGSVVYGADMARAAAAKAGRVVLVEGYTDVIALHQAGVPEVVAQMGTALTDPQVDGIARLAPKALFCQDPDRAGQESVAKGIAALRTHNRGRATRAVEFRIVRLPAGEDPADVVQRSGAEAMRALLDEAVAIERFEVERALELPDATADEMLAAATGPIASLPPGVLRDELVRLVSGRLGMGEGLVNDALRSPARTANPARPRPGTTWPPRPDRSWANTPAAPGPAPDRQLAGVGESGRANDPGRAGAGSVPPASGQPAAAHGPDQPTIAGVEEAPPPEWDGFSGDDPGPLDAPPPEWDAIAGADPGRAAEAPPPQQWAPPAVPQSTARREWVPEAEFRARNKERWRGGQRNRFSQPLPEPPEPVDPRQALAKREKTEHSFLAYCVALPEFGDERLAAVDVLDHFSAASTRQAAEHLRGRLRTPTRDLPTDNEPLARLVAYLVVWSGQLEATEAKFELAALQLELLRLERHISQARISGGTGMHDLAAERQRIVEEIHHRLI